MIKIDELNDSDNGRYVLYRPFKGAEQYERGRIKGWSLSIGIIFVVYACGDNWDNFLNYTAAGTKAEDLEFE